MERLQNGGQKVVMEATSLQVWTGEILAHGKIKRKTNIPQCPHKIQFSSVWFSCSGVSDSLRPHELRHARPPYLSPTPGVYSNSCLLSRRCHPLISSSVIPFSSCPQSLPVSGSFPMSQLFT